MSRKHKYAAALKYDPEADSAPQVVASGEGSFAQVLVDKAQELDIPIHNDPQLAQTLVGLELNQEIPSELYQAVAAIFAFVVELDKKANLG